MEDERFDSISKRLAGPVSRRGALKAAIASALGGMLVIGSGGRVFADDEGGDGEGGDERHCGACCPKNAKCVQTPGTTGMSCVCPNGAAPCLLANGTPFCCPGNQQCTGNAAKPTCTCPAATPTLCPNGQCVDTGSDASNCGACGKHCPNGYSCVNGTCLNRAPVCTPTAGQPVPTCTGTLASGTCFCETTTEGVSGCFQPAPATLVHCTTSADCATSGHPGTFCVKGTAGGVCVAPC